jgi:hypothetical protein
VGALILAVIIAKTYKVPYYVLPTRVSVKQIVIVYSCLLMHTVIYSNRMTTNIRLKLQLVKKEEGFSNSLLANMRHIDDINEIQQQFAKPQTIRHINDHDRIQWNYKS